MNKREIAVGVLYGLAIPAIVLFAVFGAVKSFATIDKYTYPVLFVWFVALIFPGLIMACFHKSRGWAAGAMIWWSYLYAAYLWLNALCIAVSLAGWFWAIIGAVFMGVGVFPVSLFAMGWHGEWRGFWELILNIATYFVIRFFGLWLLAKYAERQDAIDVAQLPPDAI